MALLKEIPMTEDQFYERFNPIKNHFYENPEDCSFDGCMFETYGQEYDHVVETCLAQKQQVWTIIEGEEDTMYFISGLHFVNRMGFIITPERVPENTEYQVKLDTK